MGITRPIPLTSKATKDWQLGEIDAQMGIPPFPPRTDEIHNTTSWSAGYHYAYRKIHGRPWMPPAPPCPAPPGSLLIASAPIPAGSRGPSSKSYDKFLSGLVSRWLSETQEIDEALFRRFVTIRWSGCSFQAEYFSHGLVVLVLADPAQPEKNDVFEFTFDFLQGDYDWAPKLNASRFRECFWETVNSWKICRQKRLERIEARTKLCDELARVLGPTWSTAAVGPIHLDSFDPHQDLGFQKLLRALQGC